MRSLTLLGLLPIIAAQTWRQTLNTALGNVNCATISDEAWPEALVEGQPFSIFCPTSLTHVADRRLQSYHIVNGRIGPQDLTDPRKQSIALTLLPGQALALEQEVDGTALLIRGPDWNVSSVGQNTSFGEVVIQPILRPLQLPLKASEVLDLPLHSAATGRSAFLQALRAANISVDCANCTLFAPTNQAIQDANLSQYSSEERRTILQGHIVEGTKAYLSTLSPGQLITTSSGSILAFGTNETVSFVVGSGTTASVLRSNIIADSSVIYLVNAVLPAKVARQDLADAAKSSRLSQEPTATSGLIGRPPGATADMSAQSSSAARHRYRWL